MRLLWFREWDSREAGESKQENVKEDLVLEKVELRMENNRQISFS